ncbi:MAG: WD repeat-containing protein jip5 [Bogoriella megaspora]|nr:MAG: WD repeat-containing protein jip5 [Bogoriella megaspora]
MFDTVCSFPLSSDLFTQAIHPSEPIIAVGLSSGHVQTLKLPPIGDNNDSEEYSSPAKNGTGQIETGWRTRRHKESCRSLGFSLDGRTLYSTGTDGLVKAASTETGQVESKIAIPLHNNQTDHPSLLHVLAPQTLLLATDSSALHLYDLRAGHFTDSKPQQTHHPHEDYISSLSPLPPTEASTSGFSKQWVSTGGATLAVTDVRRGVLVRSESQEEELLSSLYVSGLPVRQGSTSKGEKALVGGASGVLTLWEKGAWDDQDEAIVVDKEAGGGESLDVMTLVPEGVGSGGKVVAVGLGDGRVKFVRLGPNQVVGEVQHHDHEGVVGLGFDVCGRLISGGGEIVKVWHEAEPVVEHAMNGRAKRQLESDDSDDEEVDVDVDDDSEEDRKSKKKRKKRKRGKGKDRSSGQNVAAIAGL